MTRGSRKSNQAGSAGRGLRVKVNLHYGVVMMFDTLSKELYSLKQGSGENVAEFGVCLSQQVQIFHQSTREGFNRSMWRR